MKPLTVISGCPRSGTSLMMNLMRITFGDDEIIGSQFPQTPLPWEQQEDESDEHWALRQCDKQLKKQYDKTVERYEQAMDMNPDGFWECPFSVRGIPPLVDIEKGSIIKIVSQGLRNTSPVKVDKIIYMLRNPRAVARSQERLRGQFGPTTKPKVDGKEIGKHSPGMFIRVSKIAAYWLKETKTPYLVVDFDHLIAYPEIELARVREFLGKGNFTDAIEVIKPSLKRSKPKNIENPFWECADEIYAAFGKRDLQGVLDVEPPERRRQKGYRCLRLNRGVVDHECDLCRTDKQTRWNYMLNAAIAKIDWTEFPCAYDVINNKVSVEDSIKAGAEEIKVITDKHKFEKEAGVLQRMVQDQCKKCEIEAQTRLVRALKTLEGE